MAARTTFLHSCCYIMERKARVLIVENDGFIATHIKSALLRSGYVITSIVASGERAVQAVAEDPPDVVLMDMKLPGRMDGIEVAEQIRQHQNIPIIYLAGHLDISLLERVKVPEPAAYLLKPFQEQELRITIERALYKHKLETELKETNRRLKQEIAEHRQTEEALRKSEEKFRLLFENSAEGIIMITPKGKVIDANAAMLELAGCKREELVGKNLVTLLPKFRMDIKKSLQTIKNFVTTESISIQEWNFTNLKGEEVTVLPSTSLIKKGGKTVSLAVSLKDVTESKRAQEKMAEAMQKLKDLDVKKNEFVSTAAHELKTPLTSIHGFAEMLKGDELDAEKRQEALNIIESEANRLTNLINDMLGLSRIDLGTIKVTPVKTNVEEVVQQVVKQESAEAKKKGLRIEYKIGKNVPRMNTDREKLFQILLNLVSNSVNYTKEGKIVVRVEKKDGDILFRIADTGIGIAKEHQGRLFTRFFKANAVYSREVGGTGLGLSICREFAELLGGKIWFNSKKGKGSTFYLQLPVNLKKQ